MSLVAYLIVDQQGSPTPEMPTLLKELVSRYGLDGYSCRQLLLGQTEALLAKGPADRLAKIKQTLADYQFVGHVITPSTRRFAPFLLTHLEINPHALKFCGREKSLLVPRGSRLLILLAELSGSLTERNLSQILSAHRYTGTAENAGLPLEKWQKTILQGRPVLDIYLLDKQGSPTGAVRAFPSKFDHRSLGERTTLSANQNLLQLIELTQEYAGQQRVDMRFGLSPLPDASLHAAKADDLEGLKKNLRALTFYAWLQADIDRQREPSTQDSDAPALATATAGLLGTIQPGLAASLPLQQDLISELTRELGEPPETTEPKNLATTAKQTLPTPPDMQRHNVWTSPGPIIALSMFALIGLLVKFGNSTRWFGPLVAQGFSSGAFSGLLATGFFIAGFRMLQIK